MLFKTLTPEEETEYKEWAREHHSPEDIDKAQIGLYHPTIVREYMRLGYMDSSMMIDPPNSISIFTKVTVDGQEHTHNCENIDGYLVATVKDDNKNGYILDVQSEMSLEAMEYMMLSIGEQYKKTILSKDLDMHPVLKAIKIAEFVRHFVSAVTEDDKNGNMGS